MKLTREDILSLIVLAMGLLVMCLAPRAHDVGLAIAGVGLVGCVLSFIAGDDD